MCRQALRMLLDGSHEKRRGNMCVWTFFRCRCEWKTVCVPFSIQTRYLVTTEKLCLVHWAVKISQAADPRATIKRKTTDTCTPGGIVGFGISWLSVMLCLCMYIYVKCSVLKRVQKKDSRSSKCITTVSEGVDFAAKVVSFVMNTESYLRVKQCV